MLFGIAIDVGPASDHGLAVSDQEGGEEAKEVVQARPLSVLGRGRLVVLWSVSSIIPMFYHSVLKLPVI